jgi:YD repeat-containing protein
VATLSIPDDFQAVNTCDQFGLVQTATDANGNSTPFSDYDLNVGYPKLTSDALTNQTRSVYDVRGNVTQITDARTKVSSYTYDTYGRPLDSRVPLDAAAGRFIVTPPPTYDPNDNVTQAIAPNGAVSTASYDKNDQLTSTTLPKDTPTGQTRSRQLHLRQGRQPAVRNQPLGNLSPTDPNDFVTRYGYDEIYELISATNAASQRITYSYDNVGNVTKIVDPRKNATADVVSTTDKENNTTTLVCDERAKLAEARVQHKQGVTHVTRFEYDEVGNKTRTISPRGVETTDDPDDFAVQTKYDKLSRPIEQITPFDRDDAGVPTPTSTTYSYDAVGNLTKVSAPPSGTSSIRNNTTNTHFDNGWVRSTTDPVGDHHYLRLQPARPANLAHHQPGRRDPGRPVRPHDDLGLLPRWQAEAAHRRRDSGRPSGRPGRQLGHAERHHHGHLDDRLVHIGRWHRLYRLQLQVRRRRDRVSRPYLDAGHHRRRLL